MNVDNPFSKILTSVIRYKLNFLLHVYKLVKIPSWKYLTSKDDLKRGQCKRKIISSSSVKIHVIYVNIFFTKLDN